MLDTLFLSAKTLLKKPSLLGIPIVVALLLLLILFLVGDLLVGLLVDTIFLGIVPETGFLEFPWHLYTQYSLHFNVLALVALIVTIIFVWQSIFFASYAKESYGRERAKIFDAAKEANKQLKKIIALVIFFFVIAIFLLVLFWLIVNATIPLGAIGIIFPILFLILAYFLYIVLAFVVPIIAIEKAPLKEAISKSFDFVSKRFWQVVLLGIIVWIISGILFEAGDRLSGLVQEETIGMIIFLLFWAVGVSYSALVLPIYYLRNSIGR